MLKVGDLERTHHKAECASDIKIVSNGSKLEFQSVFEVKILYSCYFASRLTVDVNLVA
ncbi:hypothetical protein HanRHA438_Chr15g0706881 [Helianthus annuus]|uniref:Uncharacterized protein n=1 Tax=Helianthus annuus TaxID=4232 RepID=A0A9K3E0U0_HELAN|nr:hypothetical protein HanXRQr2_Chr15g0694431 [Helianthus annuus]KAJ0455768.1 hypothetical protein HanIR_Chr15g0754841 [Helianthus annuus]KAJ0831378.1 hypothetical protein HanPSC8_Chr15g0666351 [Helianthus annuus]KAJ0844837.1 hypothetical protein HanRHA438_Chr15g0706881 [Helianthus annuus]